MQAYPLLQTKLHIPPVRQELVSRPLLLERLSAGLDRKLTLVSAPAGFGKTTLVAQWLKSVQCPSAWLSLDENDNDATRFLVYLVSALRTLALPVPSGAEGPVLSGAEGPEPRQEPVSRIGTGVLSILQSPQPPPAEAVLTSLVNEIAALPERILLVLDDYHLIEAQAVHDALGFLVEHLAPPGGGISPPGGMHLVIATREDPQLPLARLRARGQLTELRINDLRFTPSEAAKFLNQMMGLNLSSEQVTSLETRTEGWIAGLQLAALSMRGREDIPGFISAFAGDNRYIVDYLVEEVLQRQPEQVRSFLLQTSILERLSGPLCDAVCFGFAETQSSSSGTGVRFGPAESPTGQVDGRSMLEALERGNLFVVPLDDKRRWYRYHHLFADVLQAHLMVEQPDRAPTLHLRASEWYEHNDSPAAAIRHALAAGDLERAADLAELAWPAWSGSFQSIAWLSWLKTLPDEVVRARPVLCVAYAWANLNAGNLEAAEAKLLDAERWLDPMSDPPDVPVPGTRPEPVLEGNNRRARPERSRRMVVVDEEQFQSLPASLATARAYHAQAIGDLPATVKYAQRVLDLVPEGAPQWRGDATALLGLAYWASGDLEAAHRTLADGLAGMKPLDVIVGTFVLAEMKATLGRLHEAASTCEHALRLAAEHGDPMPIGTEDVYTGISELHRERGDLEAAAQDLATAKKLGEQVELPDWQYRWCIAQARLRETLGDLDGALDLLDEAERVYVRTPLPDIRPIAALKARIWIAQGRIAEALAWARERGISVDDDLSYLREFEHLTLARVLIARYKGDSVAGSIHEAVKLLERLLKAAEEGGRMGSAIEILVLQALAYQAQDDLPRALDPLELALTLAEPEGYVRIFVDEGRPVAQLLSEAVSRGIAPDYVRKLLAVLEAEEQPGRSEDSSHLPPAQPLVEPLSKRELEVLQLIAQGLSNREICERLFLALPTVKGHNRRIYGKLQVQRRTEAVARARELGLL